MKLFVYPTGGQGPESSNPYVGNMKSALDSYFEVINPHYRWKLPRMLVFLLSSIRADVYVLNWIENSAWGRSGFRGALMSMIGLYLIRIRKSKIVWVFHNIHPHGGESFWSRRFKNFLFRNSTIIITHSQEAADYAKQIALCPVYFKNHPMKRVIYEKWDGEVIDCDFFYWSSITPYKGVLEFLENPLCKTSGKKVYVLGKCSDEAMNKRIESQVGENIIFDNRQASFSEVAAQCKKARYVIFPYIGESISSSGVLMDTLLMGGIPVGPNRGAFADLASQGCCITYNNINEVFNLPTDDKNSESLNDEKIQAFIDNNTWNSFGHWLYKVINKE